VIQRQERQQCCCGAAININLQNARLPLLRRSSAAM